jgi:hypothetical protein
LLKHQLLIVNRPRRRAPNLRVTDRFIVAVCSLFIRPARLVRSAIILRPSTILNFHRNLVKLKYRLLFCPKRRAKPGPKGPTQDLIHAVVEMKLRNPDWGCPRIAAQISLAFGVLINKDVVRRILTTVVPENLICVRVEAARAQLGQGFAEQPRVGTAISLKDPGGLGEGYERGDVYCVEYLKEAVPETTTLAGDLALLLGALKSLYDREEAVAPERGAFLLAWNPNSFEWETLAAEAKVVAENQGATPSCSRWSTMSSAIRPGDRLFLVRLGKEPKGIIASATALTEPYLAPHWSGEAGKQARYVDLGWEVLLDPEHHPPLPLAALYQPLATHSSIDTIGFDDSGEPARCDREIWRLKRVVRCFR